MNHTSLEIYSFLMHNNIQFIRYCHKEYHSADEWHKIINKWNKDVKFPDIKLFYNNKKNTYAMFLSLEQRSDLFFHDEQNSIYRSIDDANEQTEISNILSCNGSDISPLALIFDTEKKCCIYTDSYTISENDMLCFAPCSRASSVIIKSDDFFHSYLDNAEHKINLI